VNFSCPVVQTEDFVRSRKTFGNSPPGEHAKKRQIESLTVVRASVAQTDFFSPSLWRQFYERHPDAVVWLRAAAQFAVMVALAVGLRALMS